MEPELLLRSSRARAVSLSAKAIHELPPPQLLLLPPPQLELLPPLQLLLLPPPQLLPPLSW
ncbi:hypothetical protein [Nocardia suismassiliense]|uniref:hypothetical protein n=1 Tax=Nocardia suismassiliense TaxID=2077092 RepID=UPI0018FE78D4|nr:hypothetical protein [Nocardia suismassiliense]